MAVRVGQLHAGNTRPTRVWSSESEVKLVQTGRKGKAMGSDHVAGPLNADIDDV